MQIKSLWVNVLIQWDLFILENWPWIYKTHDAPIFFLFLKLTIHRTYIGSACRRTLEHWIHLINSIHSPLIQSASTMVTLSCIIGILIKFKVKLHKSAPSLQKRVIEKDSNPQRKKSMQKSKQHIKYVIKFIKT